MLQSLRLNIPVAWAAVLIVALLWPFVFPGVLLHRDMAVIDHPALSRSALGFGDLPARNAPQDGLLALVGLVLPASWFARTLVLLGAIVGAFGAWGLARDLGARMWSSLAAITLTLFNPFVVERLLQGHWSLVIAAWLLPGIAGWALRGATPWLWSALWLCSLTPTGAVVAGLVALVCRPRWSTAAIAAALSLPWLVPSLLATPQAPAAGGNIFASRAETYAGTVGALVGLGGMWNGDAIPDSRTSGWALAGVLLFFLLLTAYRRIPARLLTLAGFGLGAATLLALLPSASGWMTASVPGGALFRDSHKLVLLAVPAYAALAATLRTERLARAALVLALTQVWDAPAAVGALRPVPEPVQIAQLQHSTESRDVFAPELTTLVMINDVPTVNPLAKAVPMVENGALAVDGIQVDAPSLRFQQAQQAYRAGDLTGLAELGIGIVYADGRATELGPGPQRDSSYWLGLTLLLSWIALGAVSFGWLVRHLGQQFGTTQTQYAQPGPPAQ